VRYIGTARRYSGTTLGSVVVVVGSWRAETEVVRPSPAANNIVKAVSRMRAMKTLVRSLEGAFQNCTVLVPPVVLAGLSDSILRDKTGGSCDTDHLSARSGEVPE